MEGRRVREWSVADDGLAGQDQDCHSKGPAWAMRQVAGKWEGSMGSTGKDEQRPEPQKESWEPGEGTRRDPGAPGHLEAGWVEEMQPPAYVRGVSPGRG